MKYSRNQISRAGAVMMTSKDKQEFEQAITIINDWRSNHMYVLNALKPYLAQLFEKNGIEPLFSSSRLKRMTSIQYKLDLNPDMGLGGMQDIGGLRFVFQDTYTLDRSLELVTNNIPKGFKIYKLNDYVNKEPKPSGYRSIHIVYEYSSEDDFYDGLRVELQMRTKLEHNWATAVETAGLCTKTSLKSSQGDSKWLMFFKIVSCLMAIKEQKPVMSSMKSHTMEKLMQLCYQIDERYKFSHMLRALRVTVQLAEDKDYGDDMYLLIVDFSNSIVNITAYAESEKENAMQRYAEEEMTAEEGKRAVVLVSTENVKILKEAYRSYFLDTSEFISVIEKIKENCLTLQLV